MAEQYVLRTVAGKEYPITGLTHIGREQSNAVPLNDPSASRHHATVWVEKGQLLISDNKSANGVFVNDSQIPADKSKTLRNGDRIRIGQTELFVSLARSGSDGTVVLPQPRGNRRLPIIAGMAVALVVCLALIAIPVGLYFFTNGLPGQLPTVPPSALAQLSPSVPVTLTLAPTSAHINPVVLAVSTPPPFEPQRVGPQNEDLARAIAELNQSELDFVQAASSTGRVQVGVLGSPNLDELQDRLSAVAADALEVAATADKMSQLFASQDGGSENAGQVASQYISIAQLTAALVLEAQNLRDKLASGEIKPPEAAQVIADYGARLWNPTVATDPANPTNPFTPLLANPASLPASQVVNASDLDSLLSTANASANISAWLASTGAVETKTITVPPLLSPPVDPNDPALIASLTTAQGQTANPEAAWQVAASILTSNPNTQASGDQSTGSQVTATFQSAVAVASTGSSNGAVTPPRTLPTFPGGKTVTIIPKDNGEPVANLLGVGDDNSLTLDGQVPVTETQPLVALTLSGLVVNSVNQFAKGSSTFEAEVIYEIDVQWQANLTSPQFELDCVSGNHFDLTTVSGKQHLNAKGLLLLYPGHEDAYCYASRNGNTIGSVSLRFLVGEAAEATQRAEQVETDSVSLNMTLTADVVNTLQAEQTSAAATQSVIGTENALSTEVYGTRTAEFIATITQIARQTASAVPQITFTPTATATFTPVIIDRTFHPGDIFSVTTNVVLQPGRLYRICLSGTVNLTTGPVKPSDIDNVNGIKVPVSGCVVIGGNGQVAVISCGSGEPAEDPGGFAVEVYDLGPE